MRQTKIICTIGPACSSEEQLEALIDAGMSIARINLSHGNAEKQRSIVETIQKLNEKKETNVGILFDTRGAEIRTGHIDGVLHIENGEEVVFSAHPESCTFDGAIVPVNYDGFSKDVLETDTIIVDSGTLTFSIKDVDDNDNVHAVCEQQGDITTRRHINLPGADVDLPSITDDDWADIEKGIEYGVDFIALSFIRTAEEVEQVRKLIHEKKSDMLIITKMETVQSIEHASEIIDASDGIMVARGDLGSELPIEDLPSTQIDLVQRCRDKGVPVIIATHMLESMIENPMPTRAEVTDVAFAVMLGTDSTMLSGETATGKHPVTVINIMSKIICKTEERKSSLLSRGSEKSDRVVIHNEREARAEAAVLLAESSNADAIIVYTKSGQSAREVALFRPMMPIVAVCEDSQTARKLSLIYGVVCVVSPFGTPEETIANSISEAKSCILLESGMSVVLLSDALINGDTVNTLQTTTIE